MLAVEQEANFVTTPDTYLTDWYEVCLQTQDKVRDTVEAAIDHARNPFFSPFQGLMR